MGDVKMSVNEYCTLLVKKTNRARLMAIGKKGETYDDILTRLLDKLEKRKGGKID